MPRIILVGYFKKIKRWGKDYKFGHDGSVWSLKYRRPLKLKPRPIKSGKKIYWHVVLYKKGEPFPILIHRLILEAFVGPCPKGKEGCHNDGNCANNRAYNLRWDTRINNVKDKKRHGTENVGERNGRAKLNDNLVRLAKRLHKKGHTCSYIADMLEVHPSSIHKVMTGENWSSVA